MAKDGFVQVPADSVGKKVDGSSISVQGQVVIRQRIILGDPVASAGFANVVSGALSVRIEAQSATVNVALTSLPPVAISGTPTVNIGTFTGKVAISGTALVAGVVSIGAGTAHMGQVSVTGSVAISNTVTTNPGPVAISGTAVTVNSGFYDSSAGSTTTVRVGDSANNAIRVNVVAGAAAGTGLVSITGTATVLIGGFLDSSGQQRNLIDSANLALRVNVVAGAGGGANPVSIAAGTSNIGFINNISAAVVVTGLSGTAVAVAGTVTVANPVSLVSVTGTVVVSGLVSLTGTATVVIGAGSSHIGQISVTGTLVVTIGAGAANIGTIQAISAQVAVSFISAPVAISGTVTVAPHVLNVAAAIPSVTRGPVTTALSFTATVVVSPGAGFAIHVTRIMVTNGGAAMTRASFFQVSVSASSDVGGYCAANGGGYTVDFNPPYRLQSATALVAKVSPSTTAIIMTHFYVAP